ncbi:HD domain-containing protein [Nocardia transvalensis]|uniref:HD domain-containing protein n=1 Tax=Nocardia transvalensis TaxID=37333 RepID=UPI001E4EAA48|nr:HD domain-containing protein [Nocardia transvalensis]
MTETISLPETPLATAAHRLLTEALPDHLRHHSIRGYLFGLAVARGHGLRPGVDYDDETMFLICALHDIGLSDRANGNQRFEMDGADYAATFLEERGVTDDRVDIVWDAIAAHTTGLSGSPVYRRRRPAEIWIAVDGIGIDVMGGPGDLPPGYADLVHAAYPRLGGTRALTESIAAQAITNLHKAPPGSLPGEIVRQRHPESPYPTWDTISANGWGD